MLLLHVLHLFQWVLLTGLVSTILLLSDPVPRKNKAAFVTHKISLYNLIQVKTVATFLPKSVCQNYPRSKYMVWKLANYICSRKPDTPSYQEFYLLLQQPLSKHLATYNNRLFHCERSLALPMLRPLSPKGQRCKDFWKPYKPCRVGINWIALAECSQMSTHMPGFQSFFRFFASFVLVKLATSSTGVNLFPF